MRKTRQCSQGPTLRSPDQGEGLGRLQRLLSKPASDRIVDSGPGAHRGADDHDVRAVWPEIRSGRDGSADHAEPIAISPLSGHLRLHRPAWTLGLSRRFGRLIRPNLLNRLHADTLSTINNKSNGCRGIALSYLSECRAYARQMGIRPLISGSCVQNWPMSIM